MARPVRFVGREGELSRLLGALGGGARLVLVVGDAGVGKTRFVTEAMARAAAAGMVMVRGECLPLAGTLPLFPVADALGELGRLEGGGLLAAALDAAPGYVREEVGRLLPGMDPGGGTGPAGRDGEWSRERLFAGAAELLAAVAGRAGPGVGLVVEDVHWADSETLDFLTFLVRGGRWGPVRVVATCRGDEAPLAEHVAGWLARVRGDAGTEEIRLGPLSRAEVAGQAAALAGGRGGAGGPGGGGPEPGRGPAALERGWAIARAARDGPGLVWLALNESGALFGLAQFQRAAEVASRGLDDARQAGLQSWDLASRLAAQAAEALLALGRTAEAAARIDPLTTIAPDHDHWLAQVIRAEIDLLRGDTGAAAERWQLIETLPATTRVDFGYYAVPRAAEALLWAGRPGDALRETRRALDRFNVPDLTIFVRAVDGGGHASVC